MDKFLKFAEDYNNPIRPEGKMDKFFKFIEDYNDPIMAVLIIILGFLVVKIIGQIFKHMKAKKGNSIQLSFIKGLLQAAVIIVTVIWAGSMLPGMQTFANTILMSSSLIVVVLGFVFQEGLSNIIHGFIITLFKPFNVGDRIEVAVDGEKLTGYVETLSLRHTVVRNIIDNAECIIPNSVMDKATVRNLTTVNKINRYPLKVAIPYAVAKDQEKYQLAKDIVSAAILANTHTVRKPKQKEPLFIKVDLGESSVNLTCFVETNTAEDNFVACSEISEEIIRKFSENNIDFAFNHIELSGSVSMAQAPAAAPAPARRNTKNKRGST